METVRYTEFGVVIPGHLHFYAVGGQVEFPFYGSSGAVCGVSMAVLIHHLNEGFRFDFERCGLHDGDFGKWYVIEFSALESPEKRADRIRGAVEALG